GPQRLLDGAVNRSGVDRLVRSGGGPQQGPEDETHERQGGAAHERLPAGGGRGNHPRGLRPAQHSSRAGPGAPPLRRDTRRGCGGSWGGCKVGRRGGVSGVEKRGRETSLLAGTCCASCRCASSSLDLSDTPPHPRDEPPAGSGATSHRSTSAVTACLREGARA